MIRTLWRRLTGHESRARVIELEAELHIAEHRLTDIRGVLERAEKRAVNEANRWRYLTHALIINQGGRVILSPAMVDAGINATIITRMAPGGVEYQVINQHGRKKKPG